MLVIVTMKVALVKRKMVKTWLKLVRKVKTRIHIVEDAAMDFCIDFSVVSLVPFE